MCVVPTHCTARTGPNSPPSTYRQCGNMSSTIPPPSVAAQVGGPVLQAVGGGDAGQPRGVAADEDRLGPDDGTAGGRYPAVVPDRQQRPDEVLAVPHPSGRPVDHDADRPTGHRPLPRSP